MNPTEYQTAVARTCATDLTHHTATAEMFKLALIGLQDELGKIAGPLKKYLWHGHALDCSHLKEEIGDLLWYLVTLCTALDLSLADIMQANMDKLAHRYPDGFSQERSRGRTGDASSGEHRSADSPAGKEEHREKNTYTECWYCEECHAVEVTTVAWKDRDVYSVLYAIEDDHHRVSPQCQRDVRGLRIVNWAKVKSRADLEADPTVSRWVIEPLMRLYDAI